MSSTEKDFGLVIDNNGENITVLSIKSGIGFMDQEYKVPVEDGSEIKSGIYSILEIENGDVKNATFSYNLDADGFNAISNFSENEFNVFMQKAHPGPVHTHDGQVGDPPPGDNESSSLDLGGHPSEKHIDVEAVANASSHHDFICEWQKLKYNYPDKVFIIGFTYLKNNYGLVLWDN